MSEFDTARAQRINKARMAWKDLPASLRGHWKAKIARYYSVTEAEMDVN